MPTTIDLRTLALIETSAVASLGLSLLLTRTRPTASRAADDRRAATRVHHDAAFIDRDRDTKLEHQQQADRQRSANAR